VKAIVYCLVAEGAEFRLPQLQFRLMMGSGELLRVLAVLPRWVSSIFLVLDEFAPSRGAFGMFSALFEV
jgi:hypothetical protein